MKSRQTLIFEQARGLNASPVRVRSPASPEPIYAEPFSVSRPAPRSLSVADSGLASVTTQLLGCHPPRASLPSSSLSLSLRGQFHGGRLAADLKPDARKILADVDRPTVGDLVEQNLVVVRAAALW
jgi:hypothetical protein